MPRAKVLKFNLDTIEKEKLRIAVETLKMGGLVAFPTETVYGLGADAMNSDAVRKVFDVKGRPSSNPLIVHVASLQDVEKFVTHIPEKAIMLAERFWPGPLTLVMFKKPEVPSIITAGLSTVALRVPAHPITIELLKEFKGGIVGPSANISGKPSPTSADHVIEDLGDKIDVIIDTGPTRIGIESTVLDVTVEPPIILRLGGLSKEEIENCIGEVNFSDDEKLLKRSPGTNFRHYSPNARVIIFSKNNEYEFLAFLKKYRAEGKKIGVIMHSNFSERMQNNEFFVAINPSVEDIARNIFNALRELDKKGVDVILVEGVEEVGLGASVMDRLKKAAQLK